MRAIDAPCAIVYKCLPPVRLASLAHAIPPPGLPVALGRNELAAQVGVEICLQTAQVLCCSAQVSRDGWMTASLHQAGVLALSATDQSLQGTE